MSETGPNHIPSLDGLRAVAILIVFIGHAGLGHIVPGGFGVTIFFFISGFLITMLLCREFDGYGTVSFKAFYIRRLLRLMPPLLCALGLGIVLVLSGIIQRDLDVPTLLSQIFFVSNYYIVYMDARPIPGLGVLWSLAVEEHFYFIWPFVFVLFAQKRIGFSSLVVMTAAFLIWRCIRFFWLGSSEDTIYYLSDTRLDSLLFGCLLALLMWRGVLPANGHDSRFRRNVLLGSSVLLILGTLALRDPAFRSTLRYTIQGIALMPVFYYAVTWQRTLIFRPLNWAVFRMIGVWSYSIYLVHDMILKVLETHMNTPLGLLGSGIAGAVLTLIYAAIVHEYVEKPSARLRRRFTGHAGASRATLPVMGEARK